MFGVYALWEEIKENIWTGEIYGSAGRLKAANMSQRFFWKRKNHKIWLVPSSRVQCRGNKTRGHKPQLGHFCSTWGVTFLNIKKLAPYKQNTLA